MHAHASYLARRGSPTTVAELLGHDIIGFDTETATTRAMMKAIPSLQGRASFALRTDNDLAQLAAILAGIGIGICQVSVARREEHLIRVLPDSVGFDLGLWIVMHESLKHNARCKVAFAALVEGLSAVTAKG